MKKKLSFEEFKNEVIIKHNSLHCCLTLTFQTMFNEPDNDFWNCSSSISFEDISVSVKSKKIRDPILKLISQMYSLYEHKYKEMEG